MSVAEDTREDTASMTREHNESASTKQDISRVILKNKIALHKNVISIPTLRLIGTRKDVCLSKYGSMFYDIAKKIIIRLFGK